MSLKAICFFAFIGWQKSVTYLVGKDSGTNIQSFPFHPKVSAETTEHTPTTPDACCASKAVFEQSQQRQQLETLRCYYKPPLYSYIVSVAYLSK